MSKWTIMNDRIRRTNTFTNHLTEEIFFKLVLFLRFICYLMLNLSQGKQDSANHETYSRTWLTLINNVYILIFQICSKKIYNANHFVQNTYLINRPPIWRIPWKSNSLSNSNTRRNYIYVNIRVITCIINSSCIIHNHLKI